MSMILNTPNTEEKPNQGYTLNASPSVATTDCGILFNSLYRTLVRPSSDGHHPLGFLAYAILIIPAAIESSLFGCPFKTQPFKTMKHIILFCLILAMAGITAGSASSPKRSVTAYHHYLDSLWQANPDYCLDVECETDSFRLHSK